MKSIRTWLVRCILAAAAAACHTRTWGAEATPPADPWQDLISPDRPGAATPPTVLNPGVIQIETSFERQTAHPPGSPSVTTMDFPTLLRLGTGRHLEVRLESNLLALEPSDAAGGTTAGFSDVSLEAKWEAFTSAGGMAPTVALLPSASFPVGTADFSAGKVEAALGGLLGWTLPSGTTLSLDGDLSRLANETAGEYSWQLGSEGAFEIPLRRSWAVSGDLFVTDARVSGSAAVWGADAGLEFYPNPDVQLDLVVSHTVTDPSVATSVQVGFSRRWSRGRTHP